MTFRWLHISDVHLGSGDDAQRDIVSRKLISAFEGITRPSSRSREDLAERVLEELANVYSDHDEATMLAKGAGFPTPRLPNFTKPLVFWHKVVSASHNGVLPGGIRPIVEMAVRDYPANSTFTRYLRAQSDEPGGLLARSSKLDAIFVTGNVVSRGSSAAYDRATTFFDELGRVTELARERIFVVPGNHDVDRQRASFLARTLGSAEESNLYFAAGQRKYHFDRFAPYAEWYNGYFRGIRKFSEEGTCGPVEVFSVDGGRIGVISINTALFSVDDEDRENLWIGGLCLDQAIDELEALRPDVTFAVLHHPLAFLHEEDRRHIEHRLEGSVDIVLHGHLRHTGINRIATKLGGTLQLAAGATHRGGAHPKVALLGRIDGQAAFVSVLRYDDEDETWAPDPNGEHQFELPRRRRAVPAATHRAKSTSIPQGPRHKPSADDLADRTAASARGDDEVIEAIAAITGLSQRQVARRVKGAHGRVRLRNLFARWPQSSEEAVEPEDEDEDEEAYSAEELAGRTVAAVREDDDVLDSLVAITGISLRRVRRLLADADGRTHLGNLFGQWWPEASDDSPSGLDEAELGSRTSASVRDDSSAIAAIASITGLAERTIGNRLQQVDGRFRVRTVFSARWPGNPDGPEESGPSHSAEDLGEMTAAAARDDDDVLDSLVVVTGCSLRSVKREIYAANGRVLLRNLFADHWPEAETDDVEDQGDEDLYSAEDLHDKTVAAARGDAKMVRSIAAFTGIHPRWVKRHLNGANGRVQLRNLFAECWPGDDTEESGSCEESDDSYSAEDLADVNVATARGDQEMIDALCVITGINVRWVKRHLNGADGRTHLSNLFGDRWPDAANDEGQDPATLGSRTIASLRREPSMVAVLSAMTGLREGTVAKRINGADGRFRVRTIFQDRWPVEGKREREDSLHSADELAEWTVARARDDDDALDSLVVITGLTPQWVRRFLNGADGRMQLRNLFASRWPAEAD